MDKTQYVILFQSTSHALRLERLAIDSGIKGKLIPVPRKISSDCGVCYRFTEEEMDKIKKLLSDSNIEYEDIKRI